MPLLKGPLTAAEVSDDHLEIRTTYRRRAIRLGGLRGEVAFWLVSACLVTALIVQDSALLWLAGLALPTALCLLYGVILEERPIVTRVDFARGRIEREDRGVEQWPLAVFRDVRVYPLGIGVRRFVLVHPVRGELPVGMFGPRDYVPVWKAFQRAGWTVTAMYPRRQSYLFWLRG